MTYSPLNLIINAASIPQRWPNSEALGTDTYMIIINIQGM
jgi:hypothetical protein